MSNRTTKHSLDEKIQSVRLVKDGQNSIHQVAKIYGIAESTIKDWVRKYTAHGIEGLKEARTWKSYSPELKTEAVEYYLDGKGSLNETCEVFTISSDSVLSNWIKLYTSGKGFNSTSKGRRKTMNKGRKTTWKERIEIAQYTIAHELDYQKAQEKYGVSYQQVYGWVRKYKEKGPEGLQDRRGRTLQSKPEGTLTEEERLKLRIKELEEREKYLEVENRLLKKLEEIERRHPHG